VNTRWRQVKQLCGEALELDEQQRQAFLARACAGDAELRSEVDSILRASAAAPAHFDTPAADVAAEFFDDADESIVGKQVGAYRIESRIGSGGMGTVYAATRCDGEFQQRVAVKLINRRIVSSDAIRRFRGERQALASLNHPNVARLYDGGVTETGVPYLVMEYVHGNPIDAYCRERRLAPRAILALFRVVCAAVQHVHQNLIVHRDLKPGNILVDGDGVPKLVDFGIAKALQDASPTALTAKTTVGHARPFTPAFASPEQIRGEAVTTASDVFSLGVILYTLLACQDPFAATTHSPYELERRICEEEPGKPSSVVRTAATELAGRRGVPDVGLLRRARGLAGDIDAIVLKALRKEPAQRYVSVEQLSEDIRRYLSGLPVLAQRDTLRYRLGKFLHRRRAAVVGTAAVAVSLVAGLLATFWQARIAVRERDTALRAEKRAQAEAENARVEASKANRVTGFLQEVLASADPARQGRDVKLVDVLDRAVRNVDAEYGHDLETQSAVLSAIGNTYFALGRYDEAQRHLTRALEIQKSIHQGDHSDVASRINDLAAMLYARGELRAAQDHIQNALDMQRRLDGNKSAQVAQMLNNLGAVTRGSGDLDRAEALLTEARDMRVELFGEDSVELAETLNNLAYVRLNRNDVAGAIELTQRVLSTRRRLLGERHPLTVQSLDNAAVVYRAAGDLARAESLLWESVSLHRELLGDDHPDLATSLSNLGRLLLERQAFDAAEPLLRQALDSFRRSLTQRNPRIGRTALALAGCLIGQRRMYEAEPLLIEARDILSAAAGPSNVDTLSALRALRDVYLATDRPDDAACAQTSLEAAEAVQ
jgi:serine/threonine protein kinase